jgi:8-oxo-dGTP pyrophosphatase MutT (NUDIX family)
MHTPPATAAQNHQLPSPPPGLSPRHSATAALIRDGEKGIETWMMRRAQTMRFVPGAMVFPGGKVDSSDYDSAVALRDSELQAYSQQMATTPELARQVIHAAVRELFEETGVLLTQPPLTIGLETDRQGVEAGECSLNSLLTAHETTIDIGSIRPWARWVTPPGNPIRYDTWFFVARVPPGVTPLAVSTESDAAGWVAIESVIQAFEEKQVVLVPSTQAVLQSLHSAGSVPSVFAQAPARSLEPVCPAVRQRSDGSSEIVAGSQIYRWAPHEFADSIPGDLSHLFISD